MQLDPYKPLVTYDNHDEVIKIARHAPQAGLVLRLRVPNTGSMVELSSKFGALARRSGGSHRLCAQQQARSRGLELSRRQPVHERPELHPGAAPGRRASSPRPGRAASSSSSSTSAAASRPTTTTPSRRSEAWPRRSIQELDRLFPQPLEILAEPGRFLVASAATAVVQIIGKAVREGKLCYYVERRRLSHLQRRDFRPLPVPASRASRKGRRRSVRSSARHAMRSTRSAWPSSCPTWSSANLIYAPNIGAYSAASSTYFNGFPPAKVVHMNQ